MTFPPPSKLKLQPSCPLCQPPDPHVALASNPFLLGLSLCWVLTWFLPIWHAMAVPVLELGVLQTPPAPSVSWCPSWPWGQEQGAV